MTTVIIPAHNEESVLGRCLDAILDDPQLPEPIEVIVSCNGCTDATASVARSRRVRVIETNEASKISAIRAAEAAIGPTAFPRVYLDADVELTPGSLRVIADALADPELEAAAPAIRLDLDDASIFVRAYQAVWQELPDIKHGLAGRGAYALSADGRHRFAEFADVVADDLFIHELFWPERGRVVVGAQSMVRSSATMRDLIRRKRRVFRGNGELRGQATRSTGQRSRISDLIVIARRKPHLAVCLPVYLGVGLLCRNLAERDRRQGQTSWGTDASSRSWA